MAVLISAAERDALRERARALGATLNGKPAEIVRSGDFALVRAIDVRLAMGAEYSWQAVRHVLETRHGRFRT